MANLLKMADVQSIISLRARGWSGRKIARELGIDRETFGKCLEQAGITSKPASALAGIAEGGHSKPATAPAGLPGVSDSKPATAPTGIFDPNDGLIVPSSAEHGVALSDVAPERFSRCDPWRQSIPSKVEADVELSHAGRARLVASDGKLRSARSGVFVNS